ncbi:GNAT family N-acetyltransferase [Solwaraspora sp. WMMD1047]|uniref:GNAT family N-acetyltransferase n=1 Tax=Solwaraspora sp. WMMD1047 TaxID=3016102 RepID=UPI0024165B14|nr:GNAT family N-acetyltransferase [Solwaraspora sp. WMMD1047]MDG4830991.1 GNAT family N-acetyltransferase [Solwaraspora sp. WMMD1047]
MTTLTTRPAHRSESGSLLAICLEAFADEAVTAWVVPDPEARLAGMREMLPASLAAALDAGAVILAVGPDGEAVAASVWIDKQGAPAAPVPPTAGDPVARRLAMVVSATAARHPAVPHVYLSAMGTLPRWRGSGAGTAMLRHGLDRARGLGLPVYLEASTPSNRRLYARHGFSDHGPPVPLPDGGPVLQPMWHGTGTPWAYAGSDPLSNTR